MNSLFMSLYVAVLYYMFQMTLGHIYLDRTIDPADKWTFIKGAYFLYVGSLVTIYCQFSGLAALR